MSVNWKQLVEEWSKSDFNDLIAKKTIQGNLMVITAKLNLIELITWIESSLNLLAKK